MLIAIVVFSQFSPADSLYTHQYYYLAHIEYKREFFFYPELKKDQYKRLRSTLSLMQYDASQGIQELNAMVNDFPDLDPEIKIEMAKSYINTGNYYQASDLLLQTDQKRLLGFTYILDNKLARACNLFIAIDNYEIANDISVYINQSKKSPGTATLLSLICPGAGQIYAGNSALGIKDFLLNIGSGYLFYDAMKKKNYVDAALIFNLLFQRFYFGSVANAQKTAIETNQRNRQIWLKYMQNQYFQDLNLGY